MPAKQHRGTRRTDAPDLIRLDATHAPAVPAAAAAAVRQLLADPTALVCLHAGTGAPVVICAQHPAAGVMCAACLDAHAARHPYDLEHTCDSCGAVTDDIASACMQFHGVLRIRTTTTARPRMLAGTILVGGLGLCPTCVPAMAVA